MRTNYDVPAFTSAEVRSVCGAHPDTVRGWVHRGIATSSGPRPRRYSRADALRIVILQACSERRISTSLASEMADDVIDCVVRGTLSPDLYLVLPAISKLQGNGFRLITSPRLAKWRPTSNPGAIRTDEPVINFPIGRIIADAEAALDEIEEANA
jgi:hypothetical protein